MSPDRRPGLVLSRRVFISGGAAAFLLAACGQTPPIDSKAVVKEITPVPAVIPIPISGVAKDITPVLKAPVSNNGLSVNSDSREVSALKTQVAIQDNIIKVYQQESTKPSVPTRTPVLAKPESKVPPTWTPAPPTAPPKPAEKNLDDEAREQVYNVWLDGMTIKSSTTKVEASSIFPTLLSLETSFYDTRITGQEINRNEVIRRILSKPEQLDTKLQWTSISSGISSSVRRYTVIKGLLEINNPNVQILALPVLPSDRLNGIEYRGSALLQLANRGRYALISSTSINPVFGIPEGSFGEWKTSSVIIPFMKKLGNWQRIEEIHMSAFGRLPSSYSLSVLENWVLQSAICPNNKVCSYEI